jgi:hypothetical protein
MIYIYIEFSAHAKKGIGMEFRFQVPQSAIWKIIPSIGYGHISIQELHCTIMSYQEIPKKSELSKILWDEPKMQ